MQGTVRTGSCGPRSKPLGAAQPGFEERNGSNGGRKCNWGSGGAGPYPRFVPSIWRQPACPRTLLLVGGILAAVTVPALQPALFPLPRSRTNERVGDVQVERERARLASLSR